MKQAPLLAASVDLVEEIYGFDEFGKKTTAKKINDMDYFVNEFWTSGQRQSHSIHEISYRACFKAQLPEFFIKRLTRNGDTVLFDMARRAPTGDFRAGRRHGAGGKAARAHPEQRSTGRHAVLKVVDVGSAQTASDVAMDLAGTIRNQGISTVAPVIVAGQIFRGSIRILIPLKVRKKNGQPKILPPAGHGPNADQAQDPHILRAIGRAWSWRRRMDAGEFATIQELAEAVGLAERHVSRQLRLKF